jgi:hypothetical protein
MPSIVASANERQTDPPLNRAQRPLCAVIRRSSVIERRMSGFRVTYVCAVLRDAERR